MYMENVHLKTLEIAVPMSLGCNAVILQLPE